MDDNKGEPVKLSREFMAKALSQALRERGLSVRKAAQVAGVCPGIITNIKNRKATIDAGLNVLEQLGYEVEVKLVSLSEGP